MDGPEDSRVRLQPNSSESGPMNRPVPASNTEKNENPTADASTSVQADDHSSAAVFVVAFTCPIPSS